MCVYEPYTSAVLLPITPWTGRSPRLFVLLTSTMKILTREKIEKGKRGNEGKVREERMKRKTKKGYGKNEKVGVEV